MLNTITLVVVVVVVVVGGCDVGVEFVEEEGGQRVDLGLAGEGCVVARGERLVVVVLGENGLGQEVCEKGWTFC